MANKFTLLYVILTINSISLWGQIQRNAGQMTGVAYSGGTVEIFDLYQKGDSESTYYLDRSWSLGSIDFFKGKNFELENVPVKFDIVNNRLEVKLKDLIKVVDLKMVHTLKVFDSTVGQTVIFKNGSTVGSSKNSLFKTIFKGSSYSVLKKYYSIKRPADYNPQFDVGSRTETIQIKGQYYLYTESTKQLAEFEISTSGLKKFFSNDDKVSLFIKKNKLKIKKEEDLIHVFTLINNEQK